MIWIMGDWELYREAFLAMIAGLNPYSIGTGIMRFFYPVWSLIVVAPFAWLGYPATNVIVVILYLVTMLILARYLKMTTLKTAAFLTSASALYGLGFGNIGFLTLFGLVFPTPVALFFLIIKPQSTAIIMAVLLVKEHDRGGIKQLLRAGLPVTIALLMTIAVFGIPTPPDLTTHPAGHSPLWPYSLIVGLPLSGYAIYKRSLRWAGVASCLIFPYLTFGSYISAAIGFPIVTWVVTYLMVIVPMVFAAT